MSGPEKNHYEVLGVGLRASKNEIRDAYRRCAREAHPDTAPGFATGSSETSKTNASSRIAEISQAWAVLSDPVRRREYDAASAVATETEINESELGWETTTRREVGQNIERAKIPWRFLLVLAFLGILAILVLDTMSKPAVPAGPDGLLAPGSCIVIDGNLAAVEVRCEDAHVGVVQQVVGFDMPCPRDTEAIRDRQGLGLACVVRN